MRQWHCKVGAFNLTSSIGILLYFDENGVRYYARPVELVAIKAEMASVIEPTIVINDTDAEDMLKALAAGLDAHGIKPAAEPEAAGELKATKYHLEDLRKLLRIGRINVRKK